MLKALLMITFPPLKVMHLLDHCVILPYSPCLSHCLVLFAKFLILSWLIYCKAFEHNDGEYLVSQHFCLWVIGRVKLFGFVSQRRRLDDAKKKNKN